MIIKEELNNWRENEFQWLKATMHKKQVEEVHTDAIKDFIIPKVEDFNQKLVYADEADLLNLALCGLKYTGQDLWHNPQLIHFSLSI